MNKFYL